MLFAEGSDMLRQTTAVEILELRLKVTYGRELFRSASRIIPNSATWVQNTGYCDGYTTSCAR